MPASLNASNISINSLYYYYYGYIHNNEEIIISYFTFAYTKTKNYSLIHSCWIEIKWFVYSSN